MNKVQNLFPKETRQNLYDNTVAWIEDLISQGNLETGAKLPTEREMCEAAGVSRPVMREALRAVESKGLITIFAGKGIYVRNPGFETVAGPLLRLVEASKVDFSELMQARHIVEPNTAYLAALNRSEEHMEKLRHDLNMMERERDNGDRFLVNNQNFHFNVAKATGNPMLIILVKTLINSMVILRDYVERPSSLASIMGQHSNILEAIWRRSPSEAYRAMEEHLQDAEERHRSWLTLNSLEKRYGEEK